jgi:hypothetical protein
MNIGDHSEVLRFMIVKYLQEDLILGRSWLSKHNPIIDWKTSSFKFSRCDCIESKPVVEVIDIS